jgi:ATP synthase protein I
VVRQRGLQSLLSLGLEWSSKITAIGLEFSIPALLGFGVDHWLRTTPVATVAGAVLGFVLGMMHTLRIAKELPGGASGRRNSSGDKGEPPRWHGQDSHSDRRPV